MFGNGNDSEDSEDHLEPDPTLDEINDTGDLETTLDPENPDE